MIHNHRVGIGYYKSRFREEFVYFIKPVRNKVTSAWFLATSDFSSVWVAFYNDYLWIRDLTLEEKVKASELLIKDEYK